MKKSVVNLLAVSILGTALMSTTVVADTYFKVKVTNLTKDIVFTPSLIASTRKGARIFMGGSEASSELETIAETGNPMPLAESLDSYDHAVLGFIGPGGSDYVEIGTKGSYKYVTVAAMLIPTNDTFMALNGVRGPDGNKTISFVVPAYDAGTELNDELCVSLPGPGCGGDPGPDSDNGEGYVYISGGIRGVGDLDADMLDWNNPVAKITITRISDD
jgi:hypothetical protein